MVVSTACRRLKSKGPGLSVIKQCRGKLDETVHRFLVNRLISFAYCFYRAFIDACSAVGAKISIDLCHVIDGNGFDRARIDACSASCAGICINHSGHSCHLLLTYSTFLHGCEGNVNEGIQCTNFSGSLPMSEQKIDRIKLNWPLSSGKSRKEVA
jgi:hypothetical protein